MGIQLCFFKSFYDLFIFTNHLADRAVVMMSAGVDLRGWQETFILTAVTEKDVVEQRISFRFGKGLLLKSGSFSVNFQYFSKVI